MQCFQKNLDRNIKIAAEYRKSQRFPLSKSNFDQLCRSKISLLLGTNLQFKKRNAVVICKNCTNRERTSLARSSQCVDGGVWENTLVRILKTAGETWNTVEENEGETAQTCFYTILLGGCRQNAFTANTATQLKRHTLLKTRYTTSY